MIVSLAISASSCVKCGGDGSSGILVRPYKSLHSLARWFRLTPAGEELYGNKDARLHVAALLNLALTRQQKAILAILVRHPYLSLLDLLHPESQDGRLIQRRLDPLPIELKLARKDPRNAGMGWRERERYRSLG